MSMNYRSVGVLVLLTVAVRQHREVRAGVCPSVDSAAAVRDSVPPSGTARATAAVPALHCIDLIPPPDLRGVRGVLELRPVTGPFGLAVTPLGSPRYVLVARVAGLPAPSSLGRYDRYVAWAYTVTMDSVVRLGEVRNGVTTLGEVAREQFRLLITAEASGTGSERSGRIVLRATSPGARLLAHRDLVQPIPPGAMPIGAAPARHEHDVASASSGALRWRMPPMPAAPRMVMPGLHGLTPSVLPWLPRVAESAGPVAATPRRVVSLRDGDTLSLVASLVWRTIGGGGGGGGGGRRVVMYGFNAQYPGPLIRVPRGATIIVRFENRLDQPSTVHWHGIRLDNRFDGVPGVTQREVPPGGTFTYRVRFPDAGVYWYHPHVREDAQQDLGLYGNILVASPDRRYFAPVDREEVLALDDILLDADGIVPYGADLPTHALMGRWGNVLLVNGEPTYRLDVSTGTIVRFFLTNVSNARVYNLSFGAAPMKVVASDNGKFEREAWVTSVVIAPAERYVVDVRFDGDVALTNRVQALDHMYGTYTATVDTLGTVHAAGAPTGTASAAARAFARLRVNADVTSELAPYRKYFDRAPARTLVLDLRASDLPRPVAVMLNALNVPMDWNDGMAAANWLSTGREVTWILRDAETGRENMDIDWRFHRGEIVKLRLFNDPTALHAMAHPIHIHGQRFLVLARNGVRNANLVWKDTAIIPAGEAVDLLVEMSNPGTWLLHCHVAEHMGAGMMLRLVVE